jgi:hypothetical protein
VNTKLCLNKTLYKYNFTNFLRFIPRLFIYVLFLFNIAINMWSYEISNPWNCSCCQLEGGHVWPKHVADFVQYINCCVQSEHTGPLNIERDFKSTVVTTKISVFSDAAINPLEVYKYFPQTCYFHHEDRMVLYPNDRGRRKLQLYARHDK